MICPNPKCRKELPGNAIICPYCGMRFTNKSIEPEPHPDPDYEGGNESIPMPPEPPKKKKKKKHPFRVVLVAVAVLAGLSVLGNALGSSSDKHSASATSVHTASSTVQASSPSVQAADDPASTAQPAASIAQPAASVESDPASIATEIPTDQWQELYPDECYQWIFVEASGSTARLTLSTFRDGEWDTDLDTTAAIGSNGITYNKTEGDHATPAGTFPLCFVFSNREQDTKMPFFPIYEDSVWVCDSNSSFYNTLQSKNDPDRDWSTDKSSVENMYVKFSKKSSTACIYFSFNGDGLSQYSAENSNGGSALFLDGVGENGNMYSGYGDIKISASDMKKLLQLLDPSLNPQISIIPAEN